MKKALIGLTTTLTIASVVGGTTHAQAAALRGMTARQDAYTAYARPARPDAPNATPTDLLRAAWAVVTRATDAYTRGPIAAQWIGGRASEPAVAGGESLFDAR